MCSSPTVDEATKFLSSLKPTGSAGFEGLVVALLEAATGQRFRLSYSGQQFGQDARSESSYGNSIKAEAKHYIKAKLDARDLIAELTQAISLGPTVELWVLVTSCEVGEQIATQLEKIASDQNVEVLFLDVGTGGLPRVTVLLAAFPQILRNWIQQNQISYDAVTDLESYLRQTTADPAFELVKGQIQDKLSTTLLGYEDARRRMRDQFLRAVSDEGNALATFGQRITLLGNSRFIQRVAVNEKLILWWSGAVRDGKHAVVLGEEGTGKTWATFDWLATDLQPNRLPLLVPFSANAESILPGETIEDLLPRLLENRRRREASHFGIRD